MCQSGRQFESLKLCNLTGVFSIRSYLMNVNLKLTSVCVFGVVMALTTSLQALTSAATSNTSDGAGDNSNPYAVIVDRNIFRLNPVPLPPPPVDTKPKELPKVYLSGIIKI